MFEGGGVGTGKGEKSGVGRGCDRRGARGGRLTRKTVRYSMAVIDRSVGVPTVRTRSAV